MGFQGEYENIILAFPKGFQIHRGFKKTVKISFAAFIQIIPNEIFFKEFHAQFSPLTFLFKTKQIWC